MKTVIPDNERKACDAVARALEAVQGSARQSAYSPEDSGALGQVEYVFTLADTRYAAEHTLIEAFSGQLRSGLDFAAFIGPIDGALGSKMPPPGVYHLYFPIDPTKGLKAAQISALREDLMDWIQKTSAELHAECPNKPSRAAKPFGHKASRKDKVSGIEVTLHRETHWSHADKHDGHLLIARFAPPDYEKLRDERVQKAVDKKLPKLAKWKGEGARTLLILENQDVALSNQFAIAGSLQKALQGRSDAPDEVWLVDTTVETQWTGWCLISGDTVFPYGEGQHKYFDFDPASLTEV